MLPVHYKLSVTNQAGNHPRDTPAFRLNADGPTTVGAMTKRWVRFFLPWAAALTASSMLAYGLNVAVVGGWLNSPNPSQALIVSTSHELADTPPVYALDSCLSTWRHVSVERPDIYAAGLEQFVDSGCSAPTTRTR